MLTELKVAEFIDVLASDAPAPGGGSAAALAGSVGISLTAMVASLTVGREKYKENEEVIQQVLAEANAIKLQILECIDEDTEAYNTVMAVFSMPKNTDDEKAARKQAMQNALKEATGVPLKIMTLASQAVFCTEKAVGKTNANAASDLGVAALSLKSCLQGAWLNVLINLSGVNDEGFVRESRKTGQGLLEKSLTKADWIYGEILNGL